jgi:hypothetical protein
VILTLTSLRWKFYYNHAGSASSATEVDWAKCSARGLPSGKAGEQSQH